MDKPMVNDNTIVNGRRLRRIPFHCTELPYYEFLKEYTFNELEWFRKGSSDKPAITHILTNIHEVYEPEMDENGLEKLAMMMINTLYMIKYNDVHHDWIYGTLYDIHEFESGDYDDLVDSMDMYAMKKDIAIIKAYAKAHPELWDESFSDEELERAGIVRPKETRWTRGQVP